MAENFDLIFGSSASQSYSWNDSDYQNGWQTVGDTPPTREQFDALQRRNDTKAKELNSRLSPLEDKATADGRQTATTYAKGIMVTADGLPNGWLLECIVPGTTGTGALEIPSPLVIGGTIVDGTVTWKLLNLAMGGVPVGYVTPFLQSTAPDGWLSCAGAEVSRAAYPDLWAFVNGSSQLISETDWQSKNTSGDINIGWFSSGDGSTTFRLPRIVGSGELTEVKRFTTAGAGTFVAPVTGVYKITLQGAGGGGSGACKDNYSSYIGCGGGSGGHLEVYEKLIAGTSYSFTIGAGGTGGQKNTSSTSASTIAGGAGGTSSITVGGNSYACTGGGGGIVPLDNASGGAAGTGTINGAIISYGFPGNTGCVVEPNHGAMSGSPGGGTGGGNRTRAGALGGGGAGGSCSPSVSYYSDGAAGGDGYIEFAYNPVPQYWYVRAFGSATNQGTVDITALANMLNAKLSISDVPKIAGFSGKQTFTSSGTFTPTITGNYKITLQGGGGGGAGFTTATDYGNRGGAGGGAGGYLEFYERLVAGTSYNFTIGAGGSGGSARNDGAAGGTSSITVGNNTYTCTGGSGASANAGYVGASGTGGVGKINSETVTVGYNGQSGTTPAGGASNHDVSGGAGGGAGGGNSTTSISQTGQAGRFGGGGQGGGKSYNEQAGGNGGDGYITFEWQTASLV